MRALDGVEQVADPFAEGGAVSRDGSLAAVEVRYSTEPQDLEKADGEALLDAADTAERDGGVDVSARGILIDLASEQDAPVGELIGVGVAIILLTLLFRSLAAMAATLVGALLGVMVGQILLAALAKPLGLPQFATVIAVMLGLGAGIDYALLIIGRYREQIAAGDTPRDASAKAAATSGASVVAAGVIVMVAIAGLLVIGIPLIGKLGIAAAIGVGAVVVSALTMLPIMMGALAKRLRPKKPEHVRPSRAFERWGERVTARPWLSIAAGVLVLLIFAAPVTQLRLGQPDDGNQPEGKTQRDRLRQALEGVRPGLQRPVPARRRHPEGRRRQRGAAREAAAGGRRHAGRRQRRAAAGQRGRRDGDDLRDPRHRAAGRKTSALLERLREDVIPGATAGTPLKVYVGGKTAGFEDFSDKVAWRLPLFIAVVIGLSVLLLIAAFRSLWVPLVSAVFNLLSVGAAYGVVVAVFQEGVGASLIGVDTGVPIVSFIPVMLFAILFGLSMDYNVFLLSRIHEAYNEGDGPRESVVHGMARIGKVILFAGLIMAAVFLAFVTQPDVIAKMMGLGLGLAILIDVLLVRLVIAPAVVTLLGDRAWSLPRWLDRMLPNVSLEGHLVKGLDEKESEPVKVPA